MNAPWSLTHNACHFLLVGMQHCKDFQSCLQTHWKKNINQAKSVPGVGVLFHSFCPCFAKLWMSSCFAKLWMSSCFQKRNKMFHHIILLDVFDTLVWQTTADCLKLLWWKLFPHTFSLSIVTLNKGSPLSILKGQIFTGPQAGDEGLYVAEDDIGS